MEKLSEIVSAMELPSQCEPILETTHHDVSQDVEQILAKYGVPFRFRKCSFDSFKGNTKIIIDLKSHCEIRPLPDTAFFGKTGCGKTHLAVAMLRNFVDKNRTNGRTIKFINAVKLLLEIRSSFEAGASENEFEIVKRYAGYDLLVLDDMGSEKISEWSMATLYLILNERYCECRPTIITGNDITKISERISSRLSEGEIFDIDMPDYRKIKGIK